MEHSEGLDLFGTIAPQLAEEFSDDVVELLRDLEGHPLAIQVAARMLNSERRRCGDVQRAFAEIRDTGRHLLDQQVPVGVQQIIDQATPTVFAVLKKSTDLLTERDRERFAMLGAMAPKPATFDQEAIHVAWGGLDDGQAHVQETLNELVDHGLLEPVDNGRYQMHALLVMHAICLAGEEPSDFLVPCE